MRSFSPQLFWMAFSGWRCSKEEAWIRQFRYWMNKWAERGLRTFHKAPTLQFHGFKYENSTGNFLHKLTIGKTPFKSLVRVNNYSAHPNWGRESERDKRNRQIDHFISFTFSLPQTLIAHLCLPVLNKHIHTHTHQMISERTYKQKQAIVSVLLLLPISRLLTHYYYRHILKKMGREHRITWVQLFDWQPPASLSVCQSVHFCLNRRQVVGTVNSNSKNTILSQ